MKRLFICDDCGHVMEEKEMEDVGELDADFLYAGAIIPSGRCPKIAEETGEPCLAGCYPLMLDLANHKVLKAIHAMWDALSTYVEDPDFQGNEDNRKAGVKAIAKMQKALPITLHDDGVTR
jgi:hypothetical protein